MDEGAAGQGSEAGIGDRLSGERGLRSRPWIRTPPAVYKAAAPDQDAGHSPNKVIHDTQPRVWFGAI
jgi:hypothetical protein